MIFNPSPPQCREMKISFQLSDCQFNVPTRGDSPPQQTPGISDVMMILMRRNAGIFDNSFPVDYSLTHLPLAAATIT